MHSPKDFIRVCSYPNRQLANLAKSFLESQGIEATVVGDDLGGIHPGLAFARGVEVRVSPANLKHAEKLLNETFVPDAE